MTCVKIPWSVYDKNDWRDYDNEPPSDWYWVYVPGAGVTIALYRSFNHRWWDYRVTEPKPLDVTHYAPLDECWPEPPEEEER
ncbi:MAG TPA: hypothetical protein VMW24_24920 [Sedimentisphaerales bacterium]|nr:hypothetical protein [Sedimentisphaerales bacterium]